MRKLFLVATIATFLLPLPSLAAAPEYESVLPGLAELYKETAPSDLDNYLSEQADDLTPPPGVAGLIAFTVKPLLVLGKAHHEADRKCISDGIVAGYTVGVAGALWSVNPLFVEKRLQFRVGPGENKCKRLFYAYYNGAVARGYIEVRELPEDTRVKWQKYLTARIQSDQAWLPGSRNSVDGITYKGGSGGNLAWYYTYAHAFHKYCVRRTNDDKVDIHGKAKAKGKGVFDVQALLDAVKDGANY